MKEIFAAYKKGFLVPCSSEDKDELDKEYKENQTVKCRTTSVNAKMEPSIEQNGLLFACFEMVMENNDNPSMQTKESVKEACKIGIDFRDPRFVIVRPDGGVQFKYRSFSFKELPASRERDEVMQKAFEWASSILNISVEEMVAEAKSRMSNGGNP